MALNSRPTRRSSRANTPRTRNSTSASISAPKLTPPTHFSSHLAQRAKAQSSLDSWVEPAPLNPRPSFEDHGLERQGVLAHMEPLGTPPSAKLRAKLRGDANKRPAFMNGLALRDPDYRESPDTALSAPITRETSAKLDDVAKEDQELVKGKISEMRHEQAATLRYSNLERVVRNACQKAVETSGESSTNTAALRNMYQASTQDPQLVTAIEGILSQNPSKDQKQIFKRYVRQAKKQAKQEAPAHPHKKLKISFKRSLRDPVATPAMSPTKAVPQSEPTKTSRSSRLLSVPSSSPVAISSSPGPGRAAGTRSKGHPAANESDSDLSDVDEEIAQGPPPDSLMTNGEAAAGPPPTAIVRPKRNAPPRVAAPKGPLLARGPHPSKVRNFKRTGDMEVDSTDITDAEDDAERDNIFRQREERLRRFNDIEFPESSYRHDPQYRPQTPLSNSGSSNDKGKPKGNFTHLNGHMNGARETSQAASPQRHVEDSEASSPPMFNYVRPAWLDQKTGIRTKVTSPSKNKPGVVAAGQAPRSGGMDGLGGAGSDSSVEDETCAACGGTGSLVLCGECYEWFHYTCSDPPSNQEDLDARDEWWCTACYQPPILNPPPPRKGLFAQVIDRMEKHNVRAFRLPSYIRDFFEDVNTGPDGEYEEAGVWIKAKHRHGYLEPEDLTKLKDKNGVILCTQCGKSSLDGRPMLQCQVCQENWHMDCCDPPMAVPPSVNHEYTKRLAFKCPRHINRDLKAMEPKLEHMIDPDTIPGGYRAHRLRKPKDPVYVEPSLQRGFRNNGIIEVINDESEEEFYDEGSDGEDGQGTVYRLPERGIKLDFIHAAKQSRIKRQKMMGQVVTTAPKLESLDRHSASEQQTALNLVQLAQREGEVGLSKPDLNSLILALVAEAPDRVVSELSRPTAKHVNGSSANVDQLAFLSRLEAVIKDAKTQLKIGSKAS